MLASPLCRTRAGARFAAEGSDVRHQVGFQRAGSRGNRPGATGIITPQAGQQANCRRREKPINFSRPVRCVSAFPAGGGGGGFMGHDLTRNNGCHVAAEQLLEGWSRCLPEQTFKTVGVPCGSFLSDLEAVFVFRFSQQVHCHVADGCHVLWPGTGSQAAGILVEDVEHPVQAVLTCQWQRTS